MASRRRRRRPKIGFNDGFPELQAEGFGKQVGAKFVRYPIQWPADANTRYAYEEVRKHGIKPIMNPYSWGYGPSNKREYAQRMAELAKEYPDAIIQLWNEPNLGTHHQTGPGHRPGMGAKQAARYARAAAKAVRKVNPDARILGPSVAPTGGDWKRYARKMYRHIPKRLGVETTLNLYPTGKNRVRKIRRTVKEARSWGRPVNVTELDVSAPWLGGKPSTPKQTKKAIRAATRAGARMVLLNDLSRFRDHMQAIKRAQR